MNTLTLDAPGPTLQRLAEIENDLAIRQNSTGGRSPQVVRRSSATGSGTTPSSSCAPKVPLRQRKSAALKVTSHIGALEEAEWESLKAVIRVLGDARIYRAVVLRSQAR
jgi:hypothetical protein